MGLRRARRPVSETPPVEHRSVMTDPNAVVKGEGVVAEEGCTPLRRHARLLGRSGGVTAHLSFDVPFERASRT